MMFFNNNFLTFRINLNPNPMRILLIIISAIFLISCSKHDPSGQDEKFQMGDFVFSSNEITQNKTFTITYTGNDDLDGGYFHQVNGPDFYPVDLNFNNNIASVSIPDTISLVSFLFNIDDMPDNNKGKGYLFKVVDESGKTAADLEAAKQYYLIRQGSYSDIQGGDKILTFNTIDGLVNQSPEYADKWFETHIETANYAGNEKSDQLMKSYISTFTQKDELEVSDYEKMIKAYSANRNTKKSDSLNKLVIEKFPNSSLAKDALISDFYELQTAEEKFEYYDTYLSGLQRPNMSNVYNQLALEYYKLEDYPKFESYVDSIKNVRVKTSLLNSIAWGNAQKDENLDYMSKLSKKSVDLIKSEKVAMTHKPEFYSPSQYEDMLTYFEGLFHDTYAYIQHKKGDLQSAIEYQKEAVGEGLFPDYNEKYVQYLIEDGQFDLAYSESKVFLAEGNATEQIKTYFETAHKEFKKDEDFSAVLAELEKQAKEKYKNKIEKNIIEDIAPDFKALNLNGDEVSLESLKGKTVVLDFWATWCGPCKDSFPGMQKVLNKYEDDQDVVFLFVDTFEKGENRIKSVSSFIEKEGYTFNVLIDPYNDDKSQYHIAESYNVSGIPTKVIIDKNSNIRFKDVGYSGSESKLMQKMDIMLEMVK
jgi:thiol-disulfide isomerase/thioredoxin